MFINVSNGSTILFTLNPGSEDELVYYVCRVCDRGFSTIPGLNTHRQSDSHKELLQDLCSSVNSVSLPVSLSLSHLHPSLTLPPPSFSHPPPPTSQPPSAPPGPPPSRLPRDPPLPSLTLPPLPVSLRLSSFPPLSPFPPLSSFLYKNTSSCVHALS